MHSSRMRTVRCSGRQWGRGVFPSACWDTAQGVQPSACWDTAQRVSAPVHAGILPAEVSAPVHAGIHTPCEQNVKIFNQKKLLVSCYSDHQYLQLSERHTFNYWSNLTNLCSL